MITNLPLFPLCEALTLWPSKLLHYTLSKSFGLTIKVFIFLTYRSTKERDDWIESLRNTIGEFMKRQPSLAKVIQEEEISGFIYGKQV